MSGNCIFTKGMYTKGCFNPPKAGRRTNLGVHYLHALWECCTRAEHIFTPFCIPGS